ncbi:hypothetical protein FB470_004470 [Amycolatopsis thermophila]|uniref:Uncharacterized protein n=1 Tax=Amycolatopsis thermophila TaxID=206084 RepID=A0ABU0EYU2_9PSEU|nr:hypothetical protein [Amycolatopsis thermophila]
MAGAVIRTIAAISAPKTDSRTQARKVVDQPLNT